MHIGLFEVSPGEVSMGRVLAFTAVLCGCATLIAGICIFIYITCFAPIERSLYAAQAIALIGLATTLIGSGELLKVMQKKHEVNNG